MRFFRFSLSLGFLAAAAACAAASVSAAEPVLLQGPAVAIGANDMKADSLRMPEEMRSLVLSSPQKVEQIATNLYIRRAMAHQAAADGLERDPATAAALQIARDKVLSDALLAKIDQDVTLSEDIAEGLARNIYKAKPERFKAPDQVQARHILIAGVTPESRAQAEKTLEELKAGADFAAMAKERSADSGSAAKGGELGMFARGRMVPEFEEAAFALQKPGDLSGVVESKFGFHIIKLEARTPAGLKAFAEVRDELIQEVRGNLQQEARVAAVQKLQQDVQINTEAIKAFAASYGKESKTAP